MITKFKTTSLIYYAIATIVSILLAMNFNRVMKIDIVTKKLPTQTDKSTTNADTSILSGDEFTYRLVDTGGVGIVPDSAGWGKDYSHHTYAFRNLILDKEPFIDMKVLAQVELDFCTYLTRLKSYGYNGVVFNNFLEFINFDQLGSGEDIYESGSQERKQHDAMRLGFGRLFDITHALGMKVVLKTDMIALTSNLERYFNYRYGGIDVSDPRIWDVYAIALRELFAVFPEIEGVMLRIGEAGAVYKMINWDYYSKLYVKTDEAVRLMLNTFITVMEENDKRLFFRTWTIGIDEIGDLHTNPETYLRVLGDIDSPNLIISTKYGTGDFYRYLPVNPTFSVGQHKRIIEFQTRREFEAFSNFPNYVTTDYQIYLHEILAQNNHICGAWIWTQDGGPQRAGPLSIYPFYGPWEFNDIDAYCTARVLADPNVDIDQVLTEWIMTNVSVDATTIDKVRQIILFSQEASRKGLYDELFAQKQLVVRKYFAPPIFWFWDIVSGSHSVLSLNYYACRNQLQQSIDSGFEAVNIVRQMKQIAQSITHEKVQNKVFFHKMMAALDYEENLFETFAWYRKTFLNFYRWLDTGDEQAYSDWQLSHSTFEQRKQLHLQLYKTSLDFPAYNFIETDLIFAQAARNKKHTLTARVVLFGLVLIGLWGTIKKRFVKRFWTRFLNEIEHDPWSNNVSWKMYVKFITIVCLLLTPIIFVNNGFLVRYHMDLNVWLIGSLVLLMLGFNDFKPPASIKVYHYIIRMITPIYVMVALVLVIFAYRGPFAFWYNFFTTPVFRFVIFTCLLMTIFSFGYRYVNSVHRYLKLNWLKTCGNACLSLGVVLIVNGVIVSLLSLETVISRLNNELLVLPVGLSKVLGITTHLNIQSRIPHDVIYLGIALFLSGLTFRYGSKVRAQYVLARLNRNI
ncbi:hypothetical protein JW960_14485 [candidate division KSB1 bacterium]|nr:hypothetical protein [candidate division KSB1 bacterium]